MRRLTHFTLALIILLSCASCAPAITDVDTGVTSSNMTVISSTEQTLHSSINSVDVQTSGTLQTSKSNTDEYIAINTADAPLEADSNKDDVILTICGDGVDFETIWTLAELQSFKEHVLDLTFSTTNNWPSFGYMRAIGISLKFLLLQSGLNDGAARITLLSTDGYRAVLTYDQIFGPLYSYDDRSASGSGDATVIEPIIAWAWGENGEAREEDIRPFIGQRGPLDVNTSVFVKSLSIIEVSTMPDGNWDAPGADVPDGAKIAAGTELVLTHDRMDSVKIYYTLDGSDPKYDSTVYNPSTSYYQPDLTRPLILSQSVTVKAFAGGFGRGDSEIAVFEYTIE
jgi:hypothetical protein